LFLEKPPSSLEQPAEEGGQEWNLLVQFVLVYGFDFAGFFWLLEIVKEGYVDHADGFVFAIQGVPCEVVLDDLWAEADNRLYGDLG
jgi:hypothetical protein